MRLRTLSFILLTIVALIPCLVLSAVIYQKVYHLTENSVEEKLDRVAKQINADVTHQVAILSNGLELLSEQNLMRLGIDNLFYSQQVYVSLNNFGMNNHLIESLYLVSEDGYVVESYAGDILAFEDSEIIKFDEYKKSIMYSDNMVEGKFVDSPWVEYFNNSELLENKSDQGGIAFIFPISSSVKLDIIDIHGHLIAIVPMSKVIELANSLKNHEELVNISVEGKYISGDIIDQSSDDVIKTNRIAITNPSFKNTLWLSLNIAQSSTEIINAIHAELSPVLTTGAIILIILLLVAVATAGFISRAFNQLNHLLRGFKLGGSINTKSFFITEFKDLNKLLATLQNTINQQIQKLNDKNSELARVDKLREKYLLEVELLNTGLEQQVELRTKELALTLGKVEHGHFVFQQLIKFRRELELCNSNRSVVAATLESIQTCLPGMPIALFLPSQIKHRAVFQNVNIEGLDPYHINELLSLGASSAVNDKEILLNNEYFYITTFKASNKSFGWLIIQNKLNSPEKQSWLTLFIAEINSYLMMRSLNEHLDRAASTDSLTQLQNRKAFDLYLSKLQSKEDCQIGLYVIDVNGLKIVNDTQGHEQGDQLIIKAAEILNDCANNISSHVYRIGGDEFSIILNHQELTQADKLTAKLTQQQLIARSDSKAVSFSFGYADTENESDEMLYKAADNNMYRDKALFYGRRKDDLPQPGLTQG